jgi:transposase
MNLYLLGIDVGKESFNVALLGGPQTYQGQFSNKAAGFGKLSRWLKKHKATKVHACMEATGRYWMELALFLHEHGHQVSVVNPKLIKKHGEATMQRNKTDSQDALTIADYCAKQRPDLWRPPSQPPSANCRLWSAMYRLSRKTVPARRTGANRVSPHQK